MIISVCSTVQADRFKVTLHEIENKAKIDYVETVHLLERCAGLYLAAAQTTTTANYAEIFLDKVKPLLLLAIKVEKLNRTPNNHEKIVELVLKQAQAYTATYIEEFERSRIIEGQWTGKVFSEDMEICNKY